MTLHGSSLKAFEGDFKSKKGTKIMCNKDIPPSHDFSFNVKYGDCGIEKQVSFTFSKIGAPKACRTF